MFKHGHAANDTCTKIYRLWCHMRERCYSTACKDYQRYGGRGIVVCERWHTFDNFLIDMGECPSGLTLERIDNNGNYEPKNCRWATVRQQANNRRNNRFITIDGDTKRMHEWLQIYGVSYTGMRHRLSVGLSLEEAITKPTQQGIKHQPKEKQA